MSTQTNKQAAHGFGGAWNWLLGGAVGGIAGSAIFGLVLWLVDPTIVTETVPALYGVDPGAIGYVFHLVHGLVLGVIFGFLVTRDPVLGTLSAGVETPFIAAMGLHARFALAGLVYGLIIWTLIPIISQSVWIAASGMSEPGFPTAAFSSLVGHALYGLLLGALFSSLVAVGPEAAGTDDPFAE